MNITPDTNFLSLIDNSVSKETFQLFHNAEFDMLLTIPRPENLNKYYESDDYISHTDGRRSLFERIYQLVKGKTLNDKVKLIKKLNGGTGKLLDIGAGTGEFLAVAANHQWEIFGSEPNLKARDIAVHKNIELKENTNNFPANSFDVITMWHVLEHVEDLPGQITELKRLLKPDGTLIVAVPNFKSFDAKYYGKYWAAFDVPRHLWHFSKDSIKRLFAIEQMELRKTLPMKFDAFYVSLLSEKYKKGRMNIFKAFAIGFKSNLKAAGSTNYSSHIYILKNSPL